MTAPRLVNALVLTLAALTASQAESAETAAPRLDAAGDALPPGAVARLGTIRLRHGCTIEAVAFSADGKTVVSAASDGSIVLHDALTGKRLRSFKPETPDSASAAGVIAFAPDGRSLAAGWGRGPVTVWQVATGKRVGQFQLTDRDLGLLAFSQDGGILAGGAGGVVHIWDVPTGKLIRRIDTQWASMMTLALTPDGKTLATAILDDRRATVLSLWDTAGGRQLRRWEAHKGEVTVLAFSPDGKRLASADVEGENRLRVWAVPTVERLLDMPGAFSGLRFSPCGKLLLAASPDSVSIREAGTGKEIQRIPRAGVNGLVAFRPDSKVIALSNSWTISLWDVATGKNLDPPLEGHDSFVARVIFLPDGKTLASSTLSTLSFWQLATGKRSGRFERLRIDQGTLSPDGTTLAVSMPDEKQTIQLWDTATGKKRWECSAQSYSSYALVFSPDGKVLAEARIMDSKRTIRFWHVVTGQRLREITLPQGIVVERLAFSPDGKALAVGDGDRLHPRIPKVHLVDVMTGQALRKPVDLPSVSSDQEQPPGAYIGQIAFSRDGKRLAAATVCPGRDQAIQVWEVETGQVLCRLERIGVGLAALSPDGKSLVTMGKVSQLWEIASGKVRGQIEGHSDWVWAADFSPDGRLLATGSQDTTVLLRDMLQPNDELAPRVPLSNEKLESLWTDLAGEDAVKAYRAIGALVAAPDQALLFLREHLRPITMPTPEQLNRLIADLDARQFSVREKATRELEKLGRLARPKLQQVLAGQPSPEVRQRVAAILQRLEQSPLTMSPEELRIWRTVEVLEHIGTVAAREILEKIGRDGPDNSPVVRDARAALERLRRRMTGGGT
jgi:WD40 repeat protein